MCAGAWVVAEDGLRIVVLGCGWNMQATDRGVLWMGGVPGDGALCPHVAHSHVLS